MLIIKPNNENQNTLINEKMSNKMIANNKDKINNEK